MCIALSDFVPIIFSIACIHVANKGEWDCLLANYLRPSREEDTSTDAGSQMLRPLQEELCYDSILQSDLFTQAPPKDLLTKDLFEFDKVVQPNALNYSETRRSRSVNDSLSLLESSNQRSNKDPLADTKQSTF